MFRQTFIVVPLLSLLITGCSSDPSYKREADDNSDYLQSPELKPLIVPDSVKVPTATREYYVVDVKKEGRTGKDLDIRPPSLALPTVSDSYAVYDSGIVHFDIPKSVGFWSQIPTTLTNKGIELKSADGSTIQTTTRTVTRIDEEQPIEASYLLQRKQTSDREYITIQLSSLTRGGSEITNPIERQYYTTEFFNMLMRELISTHS